MEHGTKQKWQRYSDIATHICQVEEKNEQTGRRNPVRQLHPWPNREKKVWQPANMSFDMLNILPATLATQGTPKKTYSIDQQQATSGISSIRQVSQKVSGKSGRWRVPNGFFLCFYDGYLWVLKVRLKDF